MSLIKRKKEWEKSEKGKRTTANVMLCFFAAFNVCFFTPMDFYITNVSEIVFPLYPVAISAAIVFAAVFAVLYTVCALTRGKANDIFRLSIFAFSLAFYIQANFLSLNMGELDGRQYSVPIWKAALNIVIWLALLAAPFVVHKKKRELCGSIIYYVSAAIVAIQIFTLSYSAVMLYFNSDDEYKDSIIFSMGSSRNVVTSKDLHTYNKDRNLIIILADEYDSFCYDYAVETDPDCVSEFDGFTYYRDTVGAYEYTRHATAYMFMNKAMFDAEEDETFFKTVKENFDSNIYFVPNYPSNNILGKYADNYIMRATTLEEVVNVDNSVYKIAFFRGMPEALKRLFFVAGDNICQMIETNSETSAYYPDNLSFYNNLPKTLSYSDNGQFKMIYLYGLHNPLNITPELKRVKNDEVSHDDQAIALNKILNSYFRVLKDNGVYDSCEIILMADHGIRNETDAKFPLLMYKPAHQTETGIKISDAPISHDEVFATLVMLSGGEPNGPTIFDIAEDEERTRHFSATDEQITGSAKSAFDRKQLTIS